MAEIASGKGQLAKPFMTAKRCGARRDLAKQPRRWQCARPAESRIPTKAQVSHQSEDRRQTACLRRASARKSLDKTALRARVGP